MQLFPIATLKNTPHMMRALFTLITFVLFSACRQPSELAAVEQWDVYELSLAGPAEGNPYMEIDFRAVFENGDASVEVPGFYDGDGQYRVRFSPDRTGTWHFHTRSNAAELSDRSGSFQCTAPTGSNHGPVRIVNTHCLQYADGSPFYAVGTTAYQWTSVAQHLQEKTLQTLAVSPFNKIRMCVFPKHYIYGNETEPWAYAFDRTDTVNDLTRPNYAFFQNFDRRVAQLRDMGIEADVILFHPYDAWGYSRMGHEMNEKYVRYMMARLSACRNVWWSLANEWDIPGFRESVDWEAIGGLLQKEDPHQRLRGIHNWYDSEDHFYDHTRPWITHVCTQTSQFYNAIKWREQYRKPLLFDEMRYEGDVPSGWGNLSGEEMASYFWMAGLSGGYPTHGDTYRNDADADAEVRWWGKGGSIPGTSMPRIAFFKSIMEEAPVTGMVPRLVPADRPENLGANIYILFKPGTYFLAYCATGNRELEIDFGPEGSFGLEVIDTWNMQITATGQQFSGKATVRMPDKAYQALRFKRL
jgi:hypothetical protein